MVKVVGCSEVRGAGGWVGKASKRIPRPTLDRESRIFGEGT